MQAAQLRIGDPRLDLRAVVEQEIAAAGAQPLPAQLGDDRGADLLDPRRASARLLREQTEPHAQLRAEDGEGAERPVGPLVIRRIAPVQQEDDLLRLDDELSERGERGERKERGR